MHVFSRTEWACSGHIEQPVHTACLTHTDVLLLLVLATALASRCCFSIIAGSGTSSVFFSFVLQAIFCMLVCPTLSIALRLPPSTFLAQYVHSTGASLLLRAIVAAVLTQTLIVFRYLF
jgi:hypothetical protein